MASWHKYYCPLRPPDIGAVPPHPVRVEYVACEVDGRRCHGAVYYDRRLSAVEVECYELLEVCNDKCRNDVEQHRSLGNPAGFFR